MKYVYLIPLIGGKDDLFNEDDSFILIFANSFDDAGHRLEAKNYKYDTNIAKWRLLTCNDENLYHYNGLIFKNSDKLYIINMIENHYENISQEDNMDNYINVYDYMYWRDYNEQIQQLADKALPEKWSSDSDDQSENNILKNYLRYTFNKLQDENKIVETDTYCLFNTGLFTTYYSPIYAYGEVNHNTSGNAQKWYFKGFKDEYELTSIDVGVDFPERADYFQDTTLLVFDWHCKVHPNYNHILDDINTYNRLPDCIKNSDRQLELLKGFIDTAIQKVTANYKLAIPHYYQNRIQLMIPLCFTKEDKPDVALVLDKRKGNHYQAKTCLTMEMAYMDARLIAKPESNWLCADNITEDKVEE